jgi:hypothetical protein
VQSVVHRPVVLECPDGRWVVGCRECQRKGATEAPIGIGTPVLSEREARMIKENHLARHGERRRLVTA